MTREGDLCGTGRQIGKMRCPTSCLLRVRPGSIGNVVLIIFIIIVLITLIIFFALTTLFLITFTLLPLQVCILLRFLVSFFVITLILFLRISVVNLQPNLGSDCHTIGIGIHLIATMLNMQPNL